MKRLTQYFLFAIGCFSVNGCPISQEGLTWHFNNDIDEFIPGVEHREECFQMCLDNEECKGFTFKVDDLFGGVCILFKSLGTVHECSGCESGAKPANSEPGTTCPVADNILDSLSASDALTCLEACGQSTGCVAYTWFDQSGPIKNMCFLLSSCDTTEPCEYCSSGTLNCLWTKECYIYNELSDASRNVNRNNTEDETSCDREDSASVSVDWLGAGWYRLTGDGSMLPEDIESNTLCGAQYPGWLMDEHPTDLGEKVAADVCFSSGDNCTEVVNIEVLNCGDYFTYHLEEPEECNSRYCTTNV